jgi:hypothetical protein
MRGIHAPNPAGSQMPSFLGELSDDEKERVKTWVTEKTAREEFLCPVCAIGEICIADHVVQFVPASPANIAYPAVLLVCENCGFIQMFNSVVMGISVGISASAPNQAKEANPNG